MPSKTIARQYLAPTVILLATLGAVPVLSAETGKGGVVHVTLDDTTSDPSLSGDKSMSTKLDVDTVKAGPVTFVVHNASTSMEHEMVLVMLHGEGEALPMEKKADRIDEHKVKSLGEVSDLKPGKSGTLKRKLAPGHYALICNQPGHYHAGMTATLTVTP